MKKNRTEVICLSALFIALGIILPFITMEIPTIGNLLLPMHIPVILCGFICGAPYGAIVGLCVPLLRGILIGSPVIMPTAVTMMFELGTYGLLTGLLYEQLKNRRGRVYLSLIGAMIGGRIVWGIVAFILNQFLGNVFTFQIFMTQAIINAIPGILLQLFLVPIVINQIKLEKK